MRIAIRADGGPRVGLGHLGRCMALAQAIKHFHGFRPIFLTDDPGARAWVHGKGFAAQKPRAGSWDLLITDSYRLTPGNLRNLRTSSRVLMCVDDMGRVPVQCDWVLNSSMMANKISYSGSPATDFLLGTRFHPLRQEYWTRRPHRKIRRRVRDILVLVGGGNGGGLLEKVVSIVLEAHPTARIHVVAGPFSRPDFKESANRIRVYQSPPRLSTLIGKCDLAISGGGQTLYELAFCGVPTIAILLADNQKYNVKGFVRAGAMVLAGRPEQRAFAGFLKVLVKRLSANVGMRERLSRRARSLLDAHGAKRVADLLVRDTARKIAADGR